MVARRGTKRFRFDATVLHGSRYVVAHPALNAQARTKRDVNFRSLAGFKLHGCDLAEVTRTLALELHKQNCVRARWHRRNPQGAIGSFLWSRTFLPRASVRPNCVQTGKIGRLAFDDGANFELHTAGQFYLIRHVLFRWHIDVHSLGEGIIRMIYEDRNLKCANLLLDV